MTLLDAIQDDENAALEFKEAKRCAEVYVAKCGLDLSEINFLLRADKLPQR